MGYYDIMGDDDADLLGDVEILGDDDDLMGAYQILGAAKRNRNGLARQIAARRGRVVRSGSPQSARKLTIGVDSGTTAIAAGAAATITINPVEPFRCEAFLVDPTIAPSFLITSILVGRKSQFVGTSALSAATFSALNPLVSIQWDTAQTAQPISIAVTNNTGGALRFLATLFGTAVDVG